MVAMLTNYWIQSLALVGAFVLLGLKLVLGKQDATIDAVAWALIAYAFGAKVAERTSGTARGGTNAKPTP